VRASDRAYRVLLDEIQSGDLAPGTVLAEVEQSVRLGVSRTPLREALGRLLADGLVVQPSPRLTVVSDIDAGDIRELFEVRRALEATAARLAAWPNKPGILSDWAQAVCDVRHPDPETSEVMAERVRRAVGESAARAGCTAEILDIWKWGGKIFAQDLIDSVRQTSLALGYRTQDILSQAGHDAYFVARHAPTTMIFAPCKGGITHNNAELCTKKDLEPGLNVLLHTVMARADR